MVIDIIGPVSEESDRWAGMERDRADEVTGAEPVGKIGTPEVASGIGEMPGSEARVTDKAELDFELEVTIVYWGESCRERKCSVHEEIFDTAWWTRIRLTIPVDESTSRKMNMNTAVNYRRELISGRLTFDLDLGPI